MPDLKDELGGIVRAITEAANIPDSQLLSKYRDFLTEIETLVPPTTISLFSKHSDLPHIAAEYEEVKRRAIERSSEFTETTDDFLRKCMVPTRFISAKRQDFPQKVWKEVFPLDDGLFLHGGPGSGKTHLAVAVMREAIVTHQPKIYFDIQNWRWRMARFMQPLFVSIPDLLLRIRSTFDKGSEVTEERLIDGYTGDGIVVFDDIGAEKTTEWSLQTLYTIIDRRYRERQPTIMTSNLNLDELSVKVGDRIASRIAGMTKIVQLSGSDRRLKK